MTRTTVIPDQKCRRTMIRIEDANPPATDSNQRRRDNFRERAADLAIWPWSSPCPSLSTCDQTASADACADTRIPHGTEAAVSLVLLRSLAEAPHEKFCAVRVR